MTYESFKNKLDQFIEENPDLVEEYNMLNQVPLNNLSYKLHKTIEVIRDKYNKLSVITILNSVVPMAIAEKTDVIKIAEDVFDSGILNRETGKAPLQIYFEDIKNAYTRNGNEYDIEYCKENRDKLIEMNLKSVISIAKSFKGLGLPLEDLIGAGNLGLCVAFDKFDPNRSKLKDSILNELENRENELSYNEIADLLSPVLEYGKTKAKFINDFVQGEVYKKKKVRSWINHNVVSARFNSVAVMWIKAYIMIELDNNSRLIKKSKNDIKLERENGKDVFINIDDPIGDSGNSKVSDVLYVPDNSISQTDNSESQTIFRDGMAKLLEGVKVRNRRILLQKFGIGYPRPMTPKEIAQLEGLSIARVSQIVQSTIDKMKENQQKYNLDPSILYNAIQNLY